MPIEHAISAMSETPAKELGLTELGSLEEGKCADFIVLDKDLNLLATVVGGKLAYGSLEI